MTVSELARDRAFQLVSTTATIPHLLGYHPHGSVVIQPLTPASGKTPLIHLPLREPSRAQAFGKRLANSASALTGPVVISVFTSRLPGALDLLGALALTPQHVNIFGGVQIGGRTVELWWDDAWQQTVSRKDWQAAPSATAQIVAGSTIAPNLEALKMPGPNTKGLALQEIPSPTVMQTAWQAVATGRAGRGELAAIACGLQSAALRDALICEAISEPGNYPRFRHVTRAQIAATYQRHCPRRMADFAPHFAVLAQVGAASGAEVFAPICAVAAYLSWWGGGFERAEVLCTQALAHDPQNRLAALVRTALYTRMNPPWVASSTTAATTDSSLLDAPVHAVWW